MDSIYSRKRIQIPKIMSSNWKTNKNPMNKKKKIFMLILIIAIVTFITIVTAIAPIFETLCKEKAKSVATIICNEESTKIIQNYQYDDLVTVEKDKEENITMIKTNVTTINYIISDVGEKIQKRLNQTKQEDTEIPLGSFTGSKLFSGMGPNIPFKLSVIGNVVTDFRSEFKEAGINQTLHRLYLQVDCTVSILTAYQSTEETISNQVILAENIIVGHIPNSYYNLEGLNAKDALEIVE